ncbi:MAG: hypothetical protein GTN97_03275 [Nitrosopumilaceae archaeon]|nr:hypothetical protein [Nitrosopumilaceae archaeon]
MDKTLRELQKVSKLIDEQKKKIQNGDNEPIEEIKNQRKKSDSLMEQLSELKAQEKEMDLKLKILKKREQLANMEKKLEKELEEDRFYQEKPDVEGYIKLREEKWQRDFQELILKLREIEVYEIENQVTEETKEAKENLTKEIKKLIKIKQQTKARNNFNKIKRGMGKFTKGVASFSNEMAKFSNEMSKIGGGVSNSAFNSSDWENFFDDKPTRSPSKRRKTKKTKKTKKRKKSKKRKKTTSGGGNMFGGFDGMKMNNKTMFEGF